MMVEITVGLWVDEMAEMMVCSTVELMGGRMDGRTAVLTVATKAELTDSAMVCLTV